MFRYLIELLRAFLHLGIGEDEQSENQEEQTPQSSGDDDDEDDITSLIDRQTPEVEEPDEPAPKKVARPTTPDVNAVAEAAARRALEEASKPVPNFDPEWEREERQLAEARSTGDQGKIDSITWAVNTNRTLRQSKATAAQALFEAQEMRDQNSFDRLEITQPRLYAKYKERVERELTDLRKTGRSVPRLTMLDFLVGRDMREGKLKFGSTKRQAKEEPEIVRVDRGRSPTTRGDVSGRGKMTRKQELEKRLENRRI